MIDKNFVHVKKKKKEREDNDRILRNFRYKKRK